MKFFEGLLPYFICALQLCQCRIYEMKHLPTHQLNTRSILANTNLQYKSNNTYQSCTTPKNETGHCKHLSTCFLDELQQNLTQLNDHACVIEEEFVGVCCPQNSLLSVYSVTTEDTLAGVLPAIMIDDGKGEKLRESGKSQNLSNETRNARAPRGCGVNTKIRTRIAGGKPAAPKEWPWMVALLRNGQDQNHYCGGALITDRHVLTAAHCLHRQRPRDIIVRLGEYDLARKDDTRHANFKVVEIRMHDEFNSATYEHDIGIVKMRRATIFNSYIWPICLPPLDMTFEHEPATVTGWGSKYYSGPASSTLMEVSVPVWSHSECLRSFTQRIPETVICAGGYQGGKDACQGDSGGPLVAQMENGRWVIIGIVSWGIRCGEPGHPGIYTRVNSYLSWVLSNTQF